MLYIFDNSEQVIDILDDINQDQLYIGAAQLEELNAKNNFDFQIPAHLTQAANIIEGNFVGFKDIDGNFQMFQISRVEETHSDILMKYVFCDHVFYELNDEFITSISQTATSATLALTAVLTGTRWEVGTITTSGTHDFSVTRNSALYGVQHILSIWDCELNVRLTISNNVITHRYIDLLSRRGNDTYKRFEYSDNIQEIKRTVDMDGVKTAIYGYGKSTEQTDGSILRLDFSGVTWTYPTNPANKPNGQLWVGDTAALALYGRAGGTRHRYGIYESSDQDNASDLLTETWNYLQTVNTPKITYEMKVVDLEQISGLQSEAVRLGDTVYVIDNEFKPSLKISARVITFKRYLREPEKNEVTLGNFLPVITDEAFRARDTANLVSDYKGSWDDKFSEATGVPTSALDGIINVLNNEIYSAGGYVYITDTDGLVVYDQPTKAAATKAVRIKGGIVAISNTKVSGEFVFRTFITGDGVTANEVNTGTLNANMVTVQGDTKFYWTGTNIYVINPSDNNKQIRIGKYDGTNYGIAFTEDNGATWNTIMDWSGVTVNDGNFKLKDQFNVLNYLRPQTNLMLDGSFELTEWNEASRSGNDDVTVTRSSWTFTGTDPRVYYPLSGGGFGTKPLFGSFAAVIGPNSNFQKTCDMADKHYGYKYTISAFASAYGGTTTGTLEMAVEVYKFDGAKIAYAPSGTVVVTSGQDLVWKRFYTSFDLTTLTYDGGYSYLDVRGFRVILKPNSGTPNAKGLIDGVQVVPHDRPLIYDHNSDLYALMTGWLTFTKLYGRDITLFNAPAGNSSVTFHSMVNYLSDKATIKYYDDLSDYNYWGSSTENSALVISVENDAADANADVIALKSTAATIVDSRSLIVKGAEGALLKLLGGTANHAYIEFYPNSTNLTNRRGWLGYDYAGSTTIALVNLVGNILLSVPTTSGVNIVMDNSEGGGAEPVWKPSSAGYGDLGTLSYYWKNVCTVNIYRNNEYALSSKELKEDITETDHDKLYEIVKNLHFKEFCYKAVKGKENEPKKRRIGLIAEELPEELTDLEKTAIDVDNLVAAMGSTIQKLMAKQELLEKKILDLENRINTL